MESSIAVSTQEGRDFQDSLRKNSAFFKDPLGEQEVREREQTCRKMSKRVATLNEGFADSSDEEEDIGARGEEAEEEQEGEFGEPLEDDRSFEKNADFVKLSEATKKKIGEQRELSKEEKKAIRDANYTGGVIYLGHIPHGFYEEQMKGFFSQFGTVKRLKLSRSKKTGKSKGYAFIEFDHREVADVVAKTLNGYILFTKRLVAHVIEPEKVHERMFIGAGRKFKPMPWKLIAKKRHNADRTKDQQKQLTKKLVSKERAKRKKLKELGIDYEFKGYEGCLKKEPKRTKFED
jgi:nucleolar protein 15